MVYLAKKKNSKNTTIPEEKKNKQEEDFVRKIENKFNPIKIVFIIFKPFIRFYFISIHIRIIVIIYFIFTFLIINSLYLNVQVLY